MPSENAIRYGCGLTITKPESYIKRIDQDALVITDMLGSRGPVPGAILATTTGVVIDLEAVLQYLGGMCKMTNKGQHLVVAGPYDPQMLRHYAYQDLIPGEPQVIRLSRYLGAEFVGTGTGSSSSPQTQFMLRAENGTCEVLVEAYDR